MIQNVLVCFQDDLMGQALTEQGQCTCIKRRLFLISGKANKVLQIGVFRDLFHKFTVRKQKFLLYDQRTQGHTQRLRNISGTTGEKFCIFFFENIPGDPVSKTDPPVFGIHMHPKRLIKIKKGMLQFIKRSVHGILTPLQVYFIRLSE